MAKLLPNFMFVGSMANVSAYRRKDSEKIILRTKGGPSKQKIKTSPKFEETRKNNKEFGGRATTSSRLLTVFEYLKPISDYNVAGPINSLLRPIQALDTDSPFGERNVLISRNPKLLEGFNINKRHPFEGMVQNPVNWSINKEAFTATIEFPALIPGINFFLPEGNFPVYQMIAVIAIIPDMFYEKHKYRPLPEHQYQRVKRKLSGWFPVSAGSAPLQMELQLDEKVATLPQGFSLLLAAGISFGRTNAAGEVEPAKYIGCGKIVGMA
jgi:hypothetical protein